MITVTIKEKRSPGEHISIYQLASDKEADTFILEEKERLGELFINATKS